MTDAENPRAIMGGNLPPLEIARNTVDALFEEARHWLDGSKVSTQEEADAIGLLIAQARKVEKLAKDNRLAETKPIKDQAKAIEEQYKPIETRAALVASACKDALTPWLVALKEEQDRKADEARLNAEIEMMRAREAIRSAGSIDERENAEAILRDARRTEAAAGKAEKAKAHAYGGERAIALRTCYRAEITDATAFARFAWEHHRDELMETLREIAQRQTNAGRRDLPGVTVSEERRAA